MASGSESFFSVDEVMGGLPARRASTVLFAIEGRTAQLVREARQALASYVPERTAHEQERAFLSALAQGRGAPIPLTIQDLERYAPAWASLVPSDPGIRAALARQMGEKYQCSVQFIPGIRAALGLDNEAVRAAYERHYKEPIHLLFDAPTTMRDRLNWLRARIAGALETLPPFWTAFSLTLTETVGASILALPIALASVGPLVGVALLIVLGVVNLLTVMGIVEAITRNGNMRYGTAYFGRLVADYLGRPGQVLMTPALLLLNFLILMAYYIGVGTTLTAATGITPLIWVALLFLIGVYFLRRQNLNATVAFALATGTISLAIILLLSVQSLAGLDMDNLRVMNLPVSEAGGFDFSILNLIFGVVLAAFFGHTSAGSAAKVVLRRDPTGKALLRGNVAAMTAAILLYCLWVVAVNGAIPANVLATTSGTVLVPLTERLGGAVPALGVIYAVLAMGMGSIHMSMGLFFQAREWLPARLGKEPRFWISLAPVAATFALTLWLMLTETQSFAGLLGLIGALVVPLFGGIFPVLILLASRRRGDYVPGQVFGLLGHPIVLAVLYLIYLAGVFVQGLFISQNPAERIALLAGGVIMLVFTAILFLRGTFRPRAVLELRVEGEEPRKRARFGLTSAGRPAEAGVCFDYPDGPVNLTAAQGEIVRLDALRSASFDLDGGTPAEVKVWVHQVTPEGHSEALPGRVTVRAGEPPAETDLGETAGALTFRGARPSSIHITLGMAKKD